MNFYTRVKYLNLIENFTRVNKIIKLKIFFKNFSFSLGYKANRASKKSSNNFIYVFKYI